MNRGIFLILIFALITLQGFSQKDYVGSEGEQLVPLRVNAQITKKAPSPITALKSPVQQSYFLLDTLSLPFIDDFSGNKLKSYDTSDYSQMLVVDMVTYDFTIDGLPIDTFICSSDTTWSYLFHNSIPDSLISKTPLTSYQVIFYNHPADPFAPSDTAICWDPFEVYDTIVLSSLPDTIDSIGIILDTLVNISDTLAIYPPDTSLGGMSNSLWIDEYVFINSTYPINPITVGVATFDGLNQYGAPHNGFSDPAGYGVADYLTSKPIDLSYVVTDSVYLSFYYQPQGIGNDPQATDSLVLEFFGPSTLQWYNIWSVPGSSYHNFKQVILHITNPVFLQDGFQFRFKNYGTLSGNLDHWNLDYVRLNSGRNDVDTFIVDIALVSATGSVLQSYESVPWKHYLADTTLPLVAEMMVRINNLDTADHNVGYHYNIRHQSNVSTFPFGTNNTVINRQSYLLRDLLIDTTFSSNLTDSAEFEINNYISPPPTDTIENNDTIKYIQRFYNYYAYDDGSAEWAYLLNAPGAKLAYRFTSIIPDTLRAVDIYFSQVIEDVSAEFFYLTIWNSLSPEDIIYQQAFQTPVYEDALNKYHTYLLDETLILSGTYYIGWVQETGASLNIGFDKNRDASSFLYYNVSGTWNQSIIDGSVMMRPLFGAPVILPTDVEEGFMPIDRDSKYLVFPNPAKEFIYIQTDGNANQDYLHIMIRDIYGRMVKEININDGIVPIEDLSLGLYFFTIQAADSDEHFVEKVLIYR